MKYIQIMLALPVVLYSAVSLAARPTPLDNLTEAERVYYEKSFDYAMDHSAAGESYRWESYGGSGTFTPQEIFTSKSKATCRNFSETFNVGGESGAATGIGCKRDGDDGWCKLKEGNALTCAMEPPSSAMKEAMRNAQDAAESSKGTLSTIKGWLR